MALPEVGVLEQAPHVQRWRSMQPDKDGGAAQGTRGGKVFDVVRLTDSSVVVNIRYICQVFLNKGREVGSLRLCSREPVPNCNHFV